MFTMPWIDIGSVFALVVIFGILCGVFAFLSFIESLDGNHKR